MPTTSARRWCIPWAIEYFLRQDHDAELLIVSDGTERVTDLIPDHPRVTYEHVGDSIPLGAKYNCCVELAQTPWVALWADDDWQAPWRLSYTLSRIAEHPAAEIAGTQQLLFYNLMSRRMWRYSCGSDSRDLIGGGLAFHKRYWKRHPFEPYRRRGADTTFTQAMSAEEYDQVALVLEDHSFYVAMDHRNNTGRTHEYDDVRWTACAKPLVDVVGDDVSRYDALRLS